jgi:hypothetical protein
MASSFLPVMVLPLPQPESRKHNANHGSLRANLAHPIDAFIRIIAAATLEPQRQFHDARRFL